MKLSVALCTYNGSKYIEKQIKSILNQELAVDEIVVCDDKSSDNTIEIIEAIKRKTLIPIRIYLNKTNLQVTKNFEKAIKLCTGDIVFLSDQDDLWHPNKTKKIVKYFSNHKEKDVVFTNATLCGDDDELVSNYTVLDAYELLPNIKQWNDGLDMEIMLNANRATGATMAFRKTFVETVIPFDTSQGALHDEQLAMTACIKGKLGLITDSLMAYRQHDNNVIGVEKNSWVYSGKCTSDMATNIASLIKVKDFCCKINNDRLQFYIERYNHTRGIHYFFFLLPLISDYYKYYRKYWIIFVWTDIKAAIKNTINNKNRRNGK